MSAVRILGVDPGLVTTGWGVIEQRDNTLRYIGCGTLKPSPKAPLETRLMALCSELGEVITRYRVQDAVIEETFVSKNGQSTLKLGQARGALLLTLAQHALPVHAYAPNLVKKTLTGAGRAEKSQMMHMVRHLLPGCDVAQPDAADALAMAICHSMHGSLRARLHLASSGG